MICAYDKVYLDKARVALGRMLDFAVYDLKYDITEFLICSSSPALRNALKPAISLLLLVCPVWNSLMRYLNSPA